MSTPSSDDDSARPRRQSSSKRGDDRPYRPRRFDGDRGGAPRRDDRGGFRRDRAESGDRRGPRRDDDRGGRRPYGGDPRRGDDRRPGRPDRPDRDRRDWGSRGDQRDRGDGFRSGDRGRGRPGDRARNGFRGSPRRDDRGDFRRDDRAEQRGEGRRGERRGTGARPGDRGGFRRDERFGGRAPRDNREDRRGGRGDGRRDNRGEFRRDDRRDGRRDDRRSGGPRGSGQPLRRLPIPEDVTGEEVPKEVRQELMGLPKTLAEDVAKNLVMVGRLLEEDPEQAYGYARVALRLASRVPAVRESAGFASYGVGKYAEALAEFRAARRMTGGVHLWPLMADCERGMGRPERALAMAGEPEVQKLDKAGQVEMRIVAAGARRDMGQADAAVVTLQSSELASSSVQSWSARLRYAYADALLEVGRADEAREWFAKALEADQGGATDASDRLAELDGVEFLDALDEEAESGDDPGPGEETDAGAGADGDTESR